MQSNKIKKKKRSEKPISALQQPCAKTKSSFVEFMQSSGRARYKYKHRKNTRKMMDYTCKIVRVEQG